MSSITSDREQLIEETLRLVDEGVYDSIRQASRATGASIHSMLQTRHSVTAFTNHCTKQQAHIKIRGDPYEMDHGSPAALTRGLYSVIQNS
jgi:hypothetical protein